MSKFTAVILVAILLVSSVFAVTDYVFDNNKYGYSGQYGRDRRIYDPYSRDQYFGVGYQTPFVNFGSKGPTYAMTNTGAKSAYSGVFNLDTNSMSNQGRDPARISNWDPRVRGYNRVDRAVDLLPFTPYQQALANDVVLPKGTARIFSTGDEYGAGLNHAVPNTQILLYAINLQPLGENEIYEAWLGDDESEYMMSLGLLKSGAGVTSSLIWDINRMVYMFDSVAITREPYPDTDPSPNQIVLYGRIDPSRVDMSPDPSEFERVR